MLKIEVKDVKDSNTSRVSVEAVGSLGNVIAEFCSVIGSFREKLAKLDEREGSSAEFIFKATVMAELMDIDKDFALEEIKKIVNKYEKDEKDAPVDK